MHTRSEVEDIILNFDPSAPQPRFHKMGLEAATLEASALLPSAIPWPADAKPTPAPLSPAPSETADLSRFHGYDAVVVTWTAAEAAAMATLFTPGYPIAAWYEYRHNVATYVALVTGASDRRGYCCSSRDCILTTTAPRRRLKNSSLSWPASSVRRSSLPPEPAAGSGRP